jgi:hypothetical protein
MNEEERVREIIDNLEPIKSIGQPKMSRLFAMPSAKTFSILPIKYLLRKYVENPKNWVDPFAGWLSPAGITNDHNPKRKAKYHMEAQDFAEMLDGKYDGVLFDPPYSYRQVSEHYRVAGKKATQMDTSTQFYNRVMNPLSPKIKIGGIAISFGWNSNGFGLSRGFEKIEILLVAHGGHHNDTIVTVERKIREPNAEVIEFEFA